MRDLKKEQQSSFKKAHYFSAAKQWADDVFGQVEQSRNRYQLAFLIAMGVNIAALLALFALANMKTLVPILVHHYANGVTVAEPLKQDKAPLNKAQVESDLIRYLIYRESYDVNAYRAQFDLVHLLSNANVSHEYAKEQQRNNPTSPIATLGTTSSRQVHVYSVNFLDNLVLNEKDLPKNHRNLAEVVFTLTDMNKENGQERQTHYNALISWRYITPSDSPEIRWQNWDGFEVTYYKRQLRNV